MSEKLPANADVRQLRTRAKELLRTLPAGSKLADAQLLLARQYGFDSWPKLVAEIETPVLLEQFRRVLDEGDSVGLEQLLRAKPALRKRINEPLFMFDTPAVVHVVRHREAARMLPILVRYGADPNVRSKWWAGGFSALDSARGSTVEVLLDLGARFDVWSASVQGRLDVLRELLDADPESVNAPGGDGQRPLHVAANPEIVALLVERGADLEIRDIDHEGTPIQYQVNNLPVVRELLRLGAKPDVFTAAVLDDVEMLRAIVKENPQAAGVHIGEAPFRTVKSNGGHIYAYQLGATKTPLQVAIERGSSAVAAELQLEARPVDRLVAAAWAEDETLFRRVLEENPTFEIGSAARMIAEAAQAGKSETVRLLLLAGFDPTTPGMDSGSALHVACWFGYIEVVRLLVSKVPLELRDANHGSTPLGWACHGANYCRNLKGDYLAVVEELLRAGADPSAAANSGGTSMVEQAGSRADVVAVLRQHS